MQNLIKLSASVRELSSSARKQSSTENNTAFASAGSNNKTALTYVANKPNKTYVYTAVSGLTHLFRGH